MHHLRIVYSTLDNPPSSTSLTLSYIGLGLFVCLCVVLYFGVGRTWKITLNTGHKVNPCLAIIPPVLIFSLFYLNTQNLQINVYNHDKELLNSHSKELKTVEGPVMNYSPESKDGHGEEFTVQDTLFHYSHFEEGRSGYNKTFLYGGVIRQNLYVRITYYYDGDRNAILKLETE